MNKRHQSQTLGSLLHILLALCLWSIHNNPSVTFVVYASPATTTATTTTTTQDRKPWFRNPFFILKRNRSNKTTHAEHDSQEEMGQALRMMQYDRAANVRDAISGLKMAGKELKWYRLDDGVMGGQSETVHTIEHGMLHFKGTINTNGGGFTTIRTKIPEGLQLGPKGIKLRLKGDGKTYKFVLTDGSPGQGGPRSSKPSWQFDIPTTPPDELKEVEIPFDQLLPSFGPRTPSNPSQYKFDATEMNEMGFMLSLMRSDGSSNPKETFGEGIFPFSLTVESIENLE